MQSDERPVSVGPRTTLNFSAPGFRTGLVSRGPGTPAEFIARPPAKNVPGKIALYTPERFGLPSGMRGIWFVWFEFARGCPVAAGTLPVTVTVTSRVRI